MIWAYLAHLGFNMWSDRECPEWGLTHICARNYLRFDEKVWDEILQRLVDSGFNMLVLDLGEGVRYESHPEIACDGAWSVEKLRGEIARCREMGLEMIPKLNFSTTHDAWLGPYSRAVSTREYYDVCRDLITEVSDIYGVPGFFHIGMDEETYAHQQHYEYVVVRQYDLWWHDLLFLVEQVEKAGSRAWVWSDYIWQHPGEFKDRMPKSVLQSNWYYGDGFGEDVSYVKAYDELEAGGYDQMPTGSNWTCPENFRRTVEYCRKKVDQKRLLGFFQSVWRPALPDCLDRHTQAIELAGQVIKSCK